MMTDDTPAVLSLKQAADAIGRSKQTVLRAIQNGKVTAQKDEATGEWRIQAAELFRVYAPGTGNGAAGEEMEWDVPAAVIAQYEVRTETLERSTERERQQFEDTIHDLRRRLDRSEEERRQTTTQLTALLEDQRQKTQREIQAKEQPPAPLEPTKPKGLAGWLFRTGK